MIKAQESSAMKSPMMLNKIFMKSVMSWMVLDLLVCMDEGLDPIWVMLWLQWVGIEQLPKVLRVFSLILDDSVVQDNTWCHYLP